MSRKVLENSIVKSLLVHVTCIALFLGISFASYSPVEKITITVISGESAKKSGETASLEKKVVNAKRVKPALTQTDSPVVDEKTLSDESRLTQAAPISAVASESVGNVLALDGKGGALLSAREAYLSDVRRVIEENKSYPEVARELHQTGRVEIEFKLSKDGSVVSAQVLKASRYDRLNQAALSILSRVGHFKSFPAGLGDDSLTVVLPIEYQLN